MDGLVAQQGQLEAPAGGYSPSKEVLMNSFSSEIGVDILHFVQQLVKIFFSFGLLLV
jgi:hypothetical protein